MSFLFKKNTRHVCVTVFRFSGSCVSPVWWRCGGHRWPAPSCCSWSVERHRAGGRSRWFLCFSGCRSPFPRRHLREGHRQTEMFIPSGVDATVRGGYELGRVQLSDVISRMICHIVQVRLWLVAGMMRLGIVLQRLKNRSDFPEAGAVINGQLCNFGRLKHWSHSEETLRNY